MLLVLFMQYRVYVVSQLASHLSQQSEQLELRLRQRVAVAEADAESLRVLRAALKGPGSNGASVSLITDAALGPLFVDERFKAPPTSVVTLLRTKVLQTALAHQCHPWTLVVEVGHHFGRAGLAAAQYGCAVISFQPNAIAASLARANAAVHLRSVAQLHSVVNAALFNATGQVFVEDFGSSVSVERRTGYASTADAVSFSDRVAQNVMLMLIDVGSFDQGLAVLQGLRSFKYIIRHLVILGNSSEKIPFPVVLDFMKRFSLSKMHLFRGDRLEELANLDKQAQGNDGIYLN